MNTSRLRKRRVEIAWVLFTTGTYPATPLRRGRDSNAQKHHRRLTNLRPALTWLASAAVEVQRRHRVVGKRTSQVVGVAKETDRHLLT